MTPFTLRAGAGTPIKSLTQALALLPEDTSIPARIELAPGVYREKITLNRPNTTLEGEDAASTVIVWADGANEMMPDGLKRGTFRSYTMLMDADHVTLRRLSIVNAAAPREKVGQAEGFIQRQWHWIV